VIREGGSVPIRMTTLKNGEHASLRIRLAADKATLNPSRGTTARKICFSCCRADAA